MRFLVFLVFLQYSPSVTGEVCVGPSKFVNTPAGYGHVMIASLGYFQDAYQKSAASKATSTVERAIEEIAKVKRRTAKTICGSKVLAEYVSTKDKAITAHREAIGEIVIKLAFLDEEWIRVIMAILDEKLGHGDLAERIAELQTTQEATLKSVVLASILGTYVFVDLGSGAKARLSITDSERSALIADLVRTMGPDVKKGMVGGQDNLTAAGGALYQFLTNKDWASRLNLLR